MRNSALTSGTSRSRGRGHRAFGRQADRRAVRCAQSILLAAVAAPALAMTILVAACTDITSLQQSNPDQLKATQVYTPQNAAIIVNSAQGDFECAYNEYIVTSGLFMDELANAISNTANFDLDRRTQTSDSPYGTGDCTAQQNPGIYTPLAAARASNDTAVGHLEGWTDAQVPNRSGLIGIASTYGGYSLVLLGEGMCTAAINLGPELTDAQVFAQAMIRFDTAVAAATRANDTTTLRLALLGRARTELDLGQSGAAAIDAAKVPVGFEVDVGHDAVQTRRQNLVYIHTQLGLFSSVDTSVINAFNATHDPRIAVTSTGQLGSDGITMVFFPNKDASPTSPQALAKYSEAQLDHRRERRQHRRLPGRDRDHQYAPRREWPAGIQPLASDQSRGHGRDRRRAQARVPPGRTSARRYPPTRTATGADHWSSIPGRRDVWQSVVFPAA